MQTKLLPLFLFFFLSLHLCYAQPAGSSWQLTFEDNFNGSSLDPNKWAHGFGWGPNSGAFDETTRPANATVSNGTLKIKMECDNGFKSGAINSRNKFYQRYGYWEARIKLPSPTAGLLPAFWMKHNDDKWPPELDIMEIFGSNRSAGFSVHWDDNGHKSSSGYWDGGDLSTAWHTFGVEWDENNIRWYVDGVVRRHITRSNFGKFFDQWNAYTPGSYMMLNVHAKNATWMGGNLSCNNLPKIMEVDYVRVYSKTSSTTIPTAPSNLTATAASTSQINLSWSDNSNNESGFKVERKTGATGTWSEIASSLAANTTSFQNTGLNAGTTYYYRVRAFNSSGNSSYSNEANATTQSNTSTGTNLVKNHSFENNLTDWSIAGGTVVIDGSNAQDGSKAVKVGSANWSWVQQDIAGWTAGSSYTFSAWGKAAASGNAVRVAIKTNAGDLRNFDFTSTSYTQQTATVTIPSGTSWVQVYVTNRTNGTGFADNIQLGAGTTVTAPAAPSNLSATSISTSQINLSWSDNSSDESGFKIERKTGSGGTWSEIASNLAANTTSFHNTGLAAGTTYFYRVRAFNSGGNSAYSNEASAATQSNTSTGTNLVKNHSFENNLTDWSIAGGTVVIDGSNAQDGSKAVKVGSANWSWVQQDIAGWTAGSSYTFSAWGKAATSGNAVRVAIKTNAGDLRQFDFTSTTYTQQTATVTVPSGTTWFQVYVTNQTNGTGFADNITLVSNSGARMAGTETTESLDETDNDTAPTEFESYFEMENIQFNLYPNPATDEVSISYIVKQSEFVNLSVYNSTGQEVLSKEFKVMKGANTLNLPLENMKKGLYLIHFKESSGSKVIKRLVIQ